MRIGIDTGGTFTDCVLFDTSGIRILKTLTTPDDPARGILDGVNRLAGGKMDDSGVLLHGTTVGTNAVLERSGARVALITTAGFEDLIEIGRQNRPKLYDLNVQRPPALVPRPLRWGTRERTGASGEILLRPTTAELQRLRRALRRTGAEAAAVCFLFSFANPANERAVARALRGLRLPVSVSHEILPEFREYERLSTTVINAYLAPRLGRYLERLERRARQMRQTRGTRGAVRAPKSRLFVMQSSGGLTTAARAAREPVRTILSGPAGGVVAAAWLTERLGICRAVTFDMGGTSTDVCLIDGRPATTRETTLGGLPVAVPVLDVHSVGAGGGSLARIDAGGALRAGPESAGAAPGPVCYGRGGTRPTVTDANLLLGRLDPDLFLGGEMLLDRVAAERSFREFLRSQRAASRFAGLRDPLDLARGILAVSNSAMEKALRLISVERGHDPREFALICFGGAGGLHAAHLARALGTPQVIVPPHPGAFSALGIALSDIVRDVSQSVLLPVPEVNSHRSSKARRFARDCEERFQKLERQAREELRQDGLAGARTRATRALDLRYAGQSYELSIPFTKNFRAAFHRQHEKAYGYADPERPLELVSLRLRLTVPTPKPKVSAARLAAPSSARKAIVKHNRVSFGHRLQRAPFYDRERLKPGARFVGPAVVIEYSSTTVVPPQFACRVDAYGNLVINGHEN